MSFLSEWAEAVTVGEAGQTEWAVDIDAAYDQAMAWVSQTATAKGWSADWKAMAEGIVDDAYTWSFWADGFWEDLVEAWNAVQGTPSGWTELGNTFGSASGTTTATSEYRVESTTQAQAADTIKQTIEDIAKALNPKESPWPWIAGGTAVVFLWAYLNPRR
jgi:hypothetical protein